MFYNMCAKGSHFTWQNHDKLKEKKKPYNHLIQLSKNHNYYNYF